MVIEAGDFEMLGAHVLSLRSLTLKGPDSSLDLNFSKDVFLKAT